MTLTSEHREPVIRISHLLSFCCFAVRLMRAREIGRRWGIRTYVKAYEVS